MSLPTSALLYRIIHAAMIEIRAEALECDSKLIFHLSDLVHNLPLSLERMERGEVSPEEVMQWLQDRADQKGLAGWLELRTQELQRYAGRADASDAS